MNAARPVTVPADDAPHVLIVDDDRRIRDLLSRFLTENGYRVSTAKDAAEARGRIANLVFDGYVIDVMMPGENGFDLAQWVRESSSVPILMLTARAESSERIQGLELGADDYVTKPFSPRELVARVRAVLRRPHRGEPPTTAAIPQRQRFGDLAIDQERHEVTLLGQPVGLTALEYALLTTLAAHPGRVFTRDQLLEQVWGTDYFGDDHVVDVHIANLRKKLGDEPTAPAYIETVRGAGYRFAGKAA